MFFYAFLTYVVYAVRKEVTRMGYPDDLKAKVEGKTEEVEGEAEQKMAGAKGGAKKLKGKFKEKVADFRSKVRDSIKE